MVASPNRPTIPVVVTNPTGVGGKVTIASKERIPLKQPTIKASDLVGEDGKVNADMLVRVLSLIQASIEDATLSNRSDPLGMKCIVRNVAFTSGQNTDVKHSLGTTWVYAIILSAASGAASCTLTHTSPIPANVDQSKYASITPTGTGTYDIAIFPG